MVSESTQTRCTILTASLHSTCLRRLVHIVQYNLFAIKETALSTAWSGGTVASPGALINHSGQHLPRSRRGERKETHVRVGLEVRVMTMLVRLFSKAFSNCNNSEALRLQQRDDDIDNLRTGKRLAN